jgi:hypothetical protein
MLFEEERVAVMILMSDTILDDFVYGYYLVGFKGNHDWCENIHLSLIVLLHPVEQRLLGIFYLNVAQEFIDDSALKAKYLDHICVIKLHERLEE